MATPKRRLRTWPDVLALVETRTPEASDLDFKRVLPQRSGEDGHYEIRKDAVAIANAGGGSLIYGIDAPSGERATGLHVLADAERTASVLRNALSRSIDIALEYEVFVLHEGDEEKNPKGVVEVSIRGGPPRAVERNRESAMEFWRRRDTSNRPMTAHEISEGFRRAPMELSRRNNPIAAQLTAFAIWEMRRLPPPPHNPFSEPDEERFVSYFDQTEALVRHSGEAEEELGYLWEHKFTDAVRSGGYLRNYRTAAQRFEGLLSPSIRHSEDEGSNVVAHQLFQRVVEFGHMLSYQGNRRMEDAELLIALGAKVMGHALMYATRFNAPDAARKAGEILNEQATHYAHSPKLREVFTWARRYGESAGDARQRDPLLLEAADEHASGSIYFAPLGLTTKRALTELRASRKSRADTAAARRKGRAARRG